jgi:hypothetical protein
MKKVLGVFALGLALMSCTAKDLDCTEILEVRELAEPIDGKRWVIIMMKDYELVQYNTAVYYEPGDYYCK